MRITAISGGDAMKPLLGRGFIGADDEIRTRDPHLGKVMTTVRTVRPVPCSIPQSAKPSVQSVCPVQFVYRYTITRALCTFSS